MEGRHSGDAEILAETAGAQELPQKIEALRVNFAELYAVLSEKVETIQKQFQVKHRHLMHWASKHGYTFTFLVQLSSKTAVMGGLVASLVTSTPQTIAHLGRSPTQDGSVTQALDTAITIRRASQLTVQATAQRRLEEQKILFSQLHDLAIQHSLLPDPILSHKAATAVSAVTGITVVTELEGYQLNTTIGRIGAEQHLKRYPGDSLSEHDIQSSGFAPGLGAYGYFTSSKDALDSVAIEREKYYVAVQTFLSPNWTGRVQQTYTWFRYRKVLVYDPATSKAVVAVVGDAGPALSTGKNFGGSPEVMAALNAHDGPGTPPVMVFFVDETHGQVPLGSVQFRLEER